MIAKISKGSGFGGVVRYLLDKDKSPKILDGAKQCFGEEAGEIASGFQKIAKLGNSRIPVRHYSIAFTHDDGIIDDDTKSEIANRIMEEMGFGNCQYFAVAHDRDQLNHHHAHNHDHIHIVANAITLDGSRVPDHWDYYKLQKSLRQIEKDYGFEQVPNSWEKPRRENAVAIEKQTELQVKIDRALEGEPDLQTWIDRMEADGVNLRFRVTSRGCIQGISYLADGKLTKGTDAGRGWKSFSKEFQKSPGNDIYALAANTRTESIPIILDRGQQELLAKAADMAVEKLDGKSRCRDKGVEIKMVGQVLTVRRLRPNKQMLSARKDRDGQWASIGVPHIDEKKDLNLLQPNSPKSEKTSLIANGNPLQHLKVISNQPSAIDENPPTVDLPESDTVIIQEENSIDHPIVASPVIVKAPEMESIDSSSIIAKPEIVKKPEVDPIESIDPSPIVKSQKTKPKRTHSK